MGGRPRGDAAGDLAAIDDDDFLSTACQFVGGRDPSNARADDDRVALVIVGQLLRPAHHVDIHP